MIYSSLIATGGYLPEKILTNTQLSETLDTSDEWITSRTGIKFRHIMSDEETSVSMGEAAAREALDMAGLKPDDIDMILFATCTPDMAFPSCACLLQQRLNIKADIPAFDITAVCAGFMYAMSVADQYIKQGMVKTILIVASEAMSRVVDWTDRATCILFGDGAGAAILTASDEPGIHSTHIHAQGAYKDCLFLPHPCFTREDHLRAKPLVHMIGADVFKLAVEALKNSVDEVMEAHTGKIDHIDWLVPHQANLRIIKVIAKRCKLPIEKVILTIADHGNTSAASIPLALDTGLRDGRIQKGDVILMEGFGGGMAWGSALVTI